MPNLIEPLRLVQHAHGHLGWLAAAALVHPAILLRNPRRRAHLAVGLGAGLVTLAGVLGGIVYPAYTARIKQQIFLNAPVLGLLFERKEHLAFGAMALSWAGALAYVAGFWAEEAVRAPLRRFAFWSFAIAAALAIVAAAFGTYVAAYRAI